MNRERKMELVQRALGTMLMCALLTWAAPSWAGKKILYVGDSHSCQPFGDAMHAGLLNEAGADGSVDSYASAGSSPVDWFNDWVTTIGYVERHGSQAPVRIRQHATPRIVSLLAKEPPADMVVVALGTNSLPRGEVDAYYAKMVSAILATVHSDGSPARCYWVGPPDVRKADLRVHLASFYEKLNVAIGSRCHVIDSRGDPADPLTHYPDQGGDGYHYNFPGGKEAAERWAAGVVSEIARIEASLVEDVSVIDPQPPVP